MYGSDIYFMSLALEEAYEAARNGEIPVGAVLTVGTRILARTHNLTERLNDVTAHAEILAITSAAEALGGKYLPDCTLYVTVEPCPMCAGALAWSQIGRIVYGASDSKRGFTTIEKGGVKMLHPKTIVEGGLMANEAATLMKDFFKMRRKK